MVPYAIYSDQALATVEFNVPVDAEIQRIDFFIAHSVADSGAYDVQLSFLPGLTAAADLTNQLSVIAHANAVIELTTSGAAIGARQFSLEDIGLQVQSGEKIYLHVAVSNITAKCQAFLWFPNSSRSIPNVRRRTR